MPRQWEPVVAELRNVQKLVHLAMRQDQFDADRIRAELLRKRRTFYDDELTAQAQRVGCAGRTGRLENGAILGELNEISERDALSIVNTYNYDLAAAINQIFSEVPTANRFVYAKRLREWEQKRAEWKNEQIALFTETSARAKAQQDFYAHNAVFGTATLEPKRAVCPICIGWVARGEVPLHVAQANPPPYHVNCPHTWRTMPERVTFRDCADLWMGA